MAVSWGMKKAATGLSCGGFTPPLLQTTRGAAVQSTETKPEPFSSLIYAIQNDLARQLLALAAEVENSDEHARLETDLMEDVGSALRNAADALTAERDRADRATELVRLLSDQDQCWSDGGEDCAAHGLPWVTTRKCANGAALDFLDGTEATT